MLNSVQSTTQCTLNTSVDARSLLSLHQQLKENAKLQQITINDLVLFVVSRVLVDYPQLNMLFTNNSIYRSKHVNLGFTVDTEHGLMIPVLKNAEYLSLEEMSLEARRLSSACLEGNVFPDDMTTNKIREDHKICLFNNSGYAAGENDDEIKKLW